MKYVLHWIAAASSLIGLFITLKPPPGELSTVQVISILVILIVFGFAAFSDIREDRKRARKSYKDSTEINAYMHSMLCSSGKCTICSRDASWVSDKRIYAILRSKASRGELTFFVHQATEEVRALAKLGAEVVEYGVIGFDPLTRFTIANSGNLASSYVAIGRQKPNEPHIIEEFDSSHPTYSMALDLIRSIKAAHDQSAKN